MLTTRGENHGSRSFHTSVNTDEVDLCLYMMLVMKAHYMLSAVVEERSCLQVEAAKALDTHSPGYAYRGFTERNLH